MRKAGLRGHRPQRIIDFLQSGAALASTCVDLFCSGHVAAGCPPMASPSPMQGFVLLQLQNFSSSVQLVRLPSVPCRWSGAVALGCPPMASRSPSNYLGAYGWPICCARPAAHAEPVQAPPPPLSGCPCMASPRRCRLSRPMLGRAFRLRLFRSRRRSRAAPAWPRPSAAGCPGRCSLIRRSLFRCRRRSPAAPAWPRPGAAGCPGRCWAARRPGRSRASAAAAHSWCLARAQNTRTSAATDAHASRCLTNHYSMQKHGEGTSACIICPSHCA